MFVVVWELVTLFALLNNFASPEFLKITTHGVR